MFYRDIPPLKITDVAQFDHETISAVTAFLVLTLPADESTLPDCSNLLVSVRRPVHNGDTVAAATRNGRSMTGFYRKNGDEAEIVGLNRKIRLHWRIGEEKTFLNWIFPVVSINMICRTDTKSPRDDQPGAGDGNLLDRSFQIGNQVDGFIEVVEK